MKFGDKWLMDCTNDEIKAFAASFRTGYKFNDEDCAELRKGPCSFWRKPLKVIAFLALGPGFVVPGSRAGPRPRGFTGQSLTSTIK
jgi:hypothetical protein